MRKLYLLLVICFAMVANAQLVNIPNTNFKNRLLTADANNQIAKNLSGNYFKIDANNDSQIQESEAAQVSWLEVKNAAISDLTGILSFINLHYLNCSENQITSLNLNTLHDLELLNCGFNQLSALSFTGLDSLVDLTCAYNQITTLDFITLNLEMLQCHNNLLTSLDVSMMTNLEYLFCNNNQLTSLNLNGLVNLIEVTASANQLTAVNFNGLTALEEIAIDENQLTSIDVSTLPNISVVSCTTNNLTEIICKNGHHEDVFFISNPNLAHICSDNSQISGLQSQATAYGNTNCTVDSSCLLSNGDFTSDTHFNIYPNPAKATIYIEVEGIVELKSTTIYNLLGQQLIFIPNTENITKIDISGWKAGTYLIKTDTNKGTLKNRFIKE